MLNVGSLGFFSGFLIYCLAFFRETFGLFSVWGPGISAVNPTVPRPPPRLLTDFIRRLRCVPVAGADPLLALVHLRVQLLEGAVLDEPGVVLAVPSPLLLGLGARDEVGDAVVGFQVDGDGVAVGGGVAVAPAHVIAACRFERLNMAAFKKRCLYVWVYPTPKIISI